MEKKEINKERLYNDLRALEARIKELKEPLRRTWTQPIYVMAQFQSEVENLKRYATERYVLQAWLHGKRHLADKEKNELLLERVSAEYILDEAA